MGRSPIMKDAEFELLWNSHIRFSELLVDLQMESQKATAHAAYLRTKGIYLKRYQSGICHLSGCEDYFTDVLPDEPTTYMPGSPQKVALMRLRVEHGRTLTHPEDASFADFRYGVDEYPPEPKRMQTMGRSANPIRVYIPEA